VRRRELRALVASALAALAREAPGHYARLAELLARTPLQLELDGPPFVLRFAGGAHRLEPRAAGGAGTVVRSDAATILAVLEGELELVDAALADRLFLRGSVEALSRFESALGVFADGAVRCASTPALLDELRASLATLEETPCPS